MQGQPHAAADLATLGRDWIAAWNSRDLERILALYADECEMTSDKIQALGFDSRGTLRGKAKLREYWGKALQLVPNLRFDIGDLRVRMVEYTPGYFADHWCDRGHVLYVVEGELDTELRDGRTFKLKPGMSYQVSDHGDAAHRSSTKTGAKLFIVD